jgi:hypothetical protein
MPSSTHAEMGNVRLRVVYQYSLVTKELDGLITGIRVHNKGNNHCGTQGSTFASALGQGANVHTLHISASAKLVFPCAHNHAAKFRLVPFLFPSQNHDPPRHAFGLPTSI